MNILYIDTTTPDLVVAVIRDGNVTDVTERAAGVHHSERLCGTVEQALKCAQITFADLDAYACAIGPGSFTGIRIGISTVKGYCAAVKRPYIAVNCLQAIAISRLCGNTGKAVIDAGNGYYFADYNNGIAPCLVQYGDGRATGAGSASGAADYFDGAVDLVRARFAARSFDTELKPMYIRRSQAEDNLHGN